LFAFDYLSFHRLLLIGSQRSGALRFLAHALNGIHYVALLRKEGITEISGPLDVVS
jgi:hypothetical protein